MEEFGWPSGSLLKTGGHPWLLSLLMVIGIVVGRLLFAESDSERLLTKLHFEFTDFGMVDDVAALPRRTQLSLALAAIFVGVERMSGHRRLFRKRNYRFYRGRLMQVLLLAMVLSTVSIGQGADYAVYGQR